MSNKLELTWYNKYKQKNIEPRILVENKEKSYGDQDTENMLIHGDNLLALKALENKYANQIKCIYIDPPYNTGNAFEYYDDNIEHSMWLNLMYDRIKILHKLLSDDGTFIVQLDAQEMHYCKIILDEVFGRDKFVAQVTYERSGVGGIGQGGALINTGEYILIYQKKEKHINKVKSYMPIEFKTMKRYNKILKDFGTKELVREFISKSNGEKVKVYKHSNYEIDTFSFKNKIDNDELRLEYGKEYERLFRSFLIQKENAFQQDIIKDMDKSCLYSIEYIPSRGKYEGKLTNLYYINKELIGWLKDSAFIESGMIVKENKLTNIWSNSEIPKADLPNEGQVTFPRNKKPEQLIKRLLDMFTEEGDLILDSFLGSGTTCAVAHKMKRKWIGIELGDHCYTHCIPRIKNVINGIDKSGISKSVNWKGGGGYKFYELAPSLINIDSFGEPVINKEYNAEMLAAAVALHEGFKYNPSNEKFWKQSVGNENSYLYVTTKFVTKNDINKIKEEMNDAEYLVIACTAYDKEIDGLYKNIKIKKIPEMLLSKCEFGKDNYNLNIINPPEYEEEIEEDE